MKINAIIVNFHTARFLAPLLQVLNKESAIDKIIIGDNSNESELKTIAAPFSKVRLLRFKKNIGFGAAVNRVAKKYNAGYYLLINPDTLPEAGFVEKLREEAEANNALIAGPRFYWDDQKTFKLPPAMGNAMWIQNGLELSQQSVADARIFAFDWSPRHERFWNASEPFPEPFLSGACLLIKNDPSFFNNRKIFDERFFLYYEDTDLCMRALLQNKNVICIPQAEVVHYWNQSPGEDKSKLMAESHDRFFEKYYGSIRENNQEFVSQKGEASSPIDLGEFSNSPKFQIKTANPKEVYSFEIGLNPFFVPFAQTRICVENFEIPMEIWNNLTPGVYFSRIRTRLNQTITLWKWKKL